MPKASRRPRRLVLEPVQTLRTIDTTCSALREALAEHASIEVDCSAVEDADLTLIQLLLAARRSAERSGKRLALTAPLSAAVRDALARSGVLEISAAEASAQSFWHHSSEAP